MMFWNPGYFLILIPMIFHGYGSIRYIYIYLSYMMRGRATSLPTSISYFGEKSAWDQHRMGTCASNVRDMSFLTQSCNPAIEAYVDQERPSAERWGKGQSRKRSKRTLKRNRKEKPICNILQPVGSAPYCKRRAGARTCFQWLQLRMAIWCQLRDATVWIQHGKDVENCAWR